MSINSYPKIQTQTECKNNFTLQYMALGLGGEVGEVLNEIKKLERDDNNTLTLSRKNKIITEMGDMMWYFQGICTRLNISIKDVIDNNISKILL
jgi:NTP pyrophosphatase (non-canonical NTP hydrolase)